MTRINTQTKRNDTVGVVVPVFGEGYTERLRTCIRSLFAQTLSVTAVIADGSSAGQYREEARSLGTEYVQVASSSALIIPGVVRNAGLLSLRTRYVCFLDADLVIPSPRFLETVVTSILTKHAAAIMPCVVRLTESTTARFHRDYRGEPLLIPEGCIYCDWCDSALVAARSGEVRTSHNGTEYVSDAPSAAWASSKPFRNRGYERFVWRSLVHYGTILAPRRMLLRVGGYCANFNGWGCEDKDLAWKLVEHCKVARLSEELPQLPVIHLEHGQDKFDRIMYERNLYLHDLRKDDGVVAAVTADRVALEGLRAMLHDT